MTIPVKDESETTVAMYKATAYWGDGEKRIRIQFEPEEVEEGEDDYEQ